jgi:hypothetical protein
MKGSPNPDWLEYVLTFLSIVGAVVIVALIGALLLALFNGLSLFRAGFSLH